MGGSPFDFNNGLWSSKLDPRPIFYHVPPRVQQPSRSNQAHSKPKASSTTPAEYSILKPNSFLSKRNPLPGRSKLAPIIIDSDSDSDTTKLKNIKKAKHEGSKSAPIQIDSDSDDDLSDWKSIYGGEEDETENATAAKIISEDEVEEEEDDDDFGFITEGVCTEEIPGVDQIGE
jgi:hypothetical protein